MLFSLIKTAYAESLPVDFPTQPLIEDKFQTFGGILGAILNIVFYSGIALTIIFLIIGGIRYITSGGAKEGVEAARSQVTNAIIGFIIVIGAFTIRIIIQNMLGVTGAPADVLPGF